VVIVRCTPNLSYHNFMMCDTDSNAQADELTVLSSAFTREFCPGVDDGGHQFILSHPKTQDPLVFTFWFGPSYPSAQPPQISAPWMSRDKFSSLNAELVRQWKEANGEVVLFPFFQWLSENILDFLENQAPVEPSVSHAPEFLSMPLDHANCPKIIGGEPVVDRRSKFVAHFAHVTSEAEVKQFISTMYANKPVANATHNIVAYRIAARHDRSLIEHSDDDGESGASGQILYLMQRMNVIDIVFMVTRWFGGTLLGADRFKLITGCVKELIDKYGLGKRASAD